jgi:methyl-accepting chemotaxis protein-1 (serine sensor receptor)
MDTTTQQNAALVEEAAAASQAIVEQAQALSGLVSRYNVGGGASFAKSPAAPGPERRAKDRPWAKPAGKAPVKAASAPIQSAIKKAAVNDSSEWSEF